MQSVENVQHTVGKRSLVASWGDSEQDLKKCTVLVHVIPLHAYICTSTFLQVLLSTVGLFRNPDVAFGSPLNPVGLRRVTNPSESPHGSF